MVGNTGYGVMFESDVVSNYKALVVKGTVKSDVDTAISVVNHVISDRNGRGISIGGDIVT